MIPIVSASPGCKPLQARVAWADGFAAEVDLSEPIQRFAALVAAARALGLAPRTVAYYDKGERLIPKTVGLACLGYDALRQGPPAG
ncbi:MAG: hypothetical protein B193_0972 [Solidesulfovibrio magneticus str. Maddingley MBC34]|uniref:Uncharacterized protein n=1 Tax=Solidesulfovibrio magneticus str. Maddingley MBC34 TaxID=1206767 RepID=K6GGP9_9BACT|nr:MAG: hypothetical protein B193_0972 [Solidesulfovibrio magneticus str. Maddingley MBC34]